MKKIQIAIGLTGFKAAGKDTFAEYLVTKHGFTIERTSDHIKIEARKRGIHEPTTKDLQDIGDAVRKETTDPGCWVKRMVDHAENTDSTKVVLNGLRNPLEIPVLQQMLGDRFTPVGIVAPTAVRARRFMARSPKDAPTLDYFLVIDDRDRGINQPSYGQQVDRTLALVPYENVYNNATTLEALYAWADALVAKLT